MFARTAIFISLAMLAACPASVSHDGEAIYGGIIKMRKRHARINGFGQNIPQRLGQIHRDPAQGFGLPANGCESFLITEHSCTDSILLFHLQNILFSRSELYV